ncbi:DUF3267 domain-containing protein [Halorubrum saccharovorum]|uniref:DUF3267 domain-containing protein n=1 Tax=Halorubrum saccharovorum TaxID=2248 RepID=UPI000678F661|nr:DUF3267 domain-containing protein [Halorubrum saccharovorum]
MTDSPASATSDDDDGTERVLGELTLTRALAIQMTAVGTLGTVAGWTLFAGLFGFVTGETVGFRFAPASLGWITTPVDILIVVFLGTFFLVPHEWLHGLAIRYYGGEPRYGVGVAHFVLPYAYATTDHEFTRNQFVVVLLTPLVVMTAVGVPLMLAFGWGWLVLPLTLNTAGAIADLWMTVSVLGYPAHVRIVDHETGARIMGREGDTPRTPSVTAVAWDALAGAAVAVVATALALTIGGPLLLPALGVESIVVGTPGRITYLFEFANTPDEISLGVGPAVFGVGGLIGLAYALVQAYHRGRRPRVDAT